MTAGPCPVDLTLTDPTTVVHAVADHLAGRCVQLVWGTLDGVWRGPAVILGCSRVAGHSIFVAVGLPTVDAELAVVFLAWDEILGVNIDLDGDPPAHMLDRVATISRWFGHQMAIIQRDGTSVAGSVSGFEIEDEDVLVYLQEPRDPDRPDEDCEAFVTFDAIDAVVDLGV